MSNHGEDLLKHQIIDFFLFYLHAYIRLKILTLTIVIVWIRIDRAFAVSRTFDRGHHGVGHTLATVDVS